MMPSHCYGLAALLVGLIVGGSVNAELLENANLAQGNLAWRGDGKVVMQNGQPVLAMELKKNRMVSFQQTIKTKRISEFELSFKVMPSPDFNGKSITMRFERPKNGGSTYTAKEILPTQEWQEVRWKFGEVRGDSQLTFVVETKEGTGTLYFKDLSIAE